MTLKQEIQQIVKGDVADDRATLLANSTDASIFQVEPELVVSPHGVDDIKNLVKFVSSHKAEFPHLSLTARSAGTDMSGGPLTESIVVDYLKYFQGIVSFGEIHSEVRVLPGTYYRDFEKATLEKGLILPCYTASKELNTIGGMVANNSAGEKTLSYGATRDYVQALSVVLSDGNEYHTKPLSRGELEAKVSQSDFEGSIYRKVKELCEKNSALIAEARPKVHKNSAGYTLWRVWDGKTFDINQLLVGSQGTLGLVTEATLRLVKPKQHSALLVIFLHEFDKLADVVNLILSHKPESFESYDDHTMKLAVRFMPDMWKQLGTSNLFKLGWKFLPEIKMMLVGGTPKLIMVAEFTGNSEEEVYAAARKAEADLQKHGQQMHVYKNDDHIAKDDAEENKYWTIRRESFNLLRKHVHGKHTAPFIDDIVVAPEHLPKFLPELNAITNSYKIDYTIAGHIGDGNFHIIPLMDFSRPDLRQVITDLSKKVYDLVGKYGGSITGEHNDGLIRTSFLDRMYKPEMLRLFAEVKNIFDPQNIFNPRKKVNGDLGYSLSHIRHW